MQKECHDCHKETVQRLIDKFNPDEISIEKLNSALDLLSNNRDSLSNPEFAMHVQRLAKMNLGNTNLYKEEKSRANRLVYSQYQQWRLRIKKSDNPHLLAVKLAVAGNVIDYGAHTVPDDIPLAIEGLVKKSLKVDQTELMLKRLKEAKRVLYLGDNAGEMVFDKLFIQLLNHDNVTFVTRGKAVINDATVEDAKQIGMQEVCKVIDNGSDAPSTLLNQCSDEFLEIYRNADLIISKGMGNFEGLMNEADPRIFFMLMAKCNPIAKLLGVAKGDMLVTQFLS